MKNHLEIAILISIFLGLVSGGLLIVSYNIWATNKKHDDYRLCLEKNDQLLRTVSADKYVRLHPCSN